MSNVEREEEACSRREGGVVCPSLDEVGVIIRRLISVVEPTAVLSLLPFEGFLLMLRSERFPLVSWEEEELLFILLLI